MTKVIGNELGLLHLFALLVLFFTNKPGLKARNMEAPIAPVVEALPMAG